ncbi:hypothetical protein D3C81_1827090 [compost metagenome]
MVISEIRSELRRTFFMVSITFCEIRLPSLAFCEASSASRRAWLAFSAFSATVEVSSSMLAAVSTTAADCCSVREDKSILPAAISVEERATLSTPSRTSLIMLFRFSFMVETACISSPGSS